MRLAMRKLLAILVALLSTGSLPQSGAQETEPAVLSHAPGQSLGSVSLWPKQLASSPRMRFAPLEVFSAAGIESVGIDPLLIERVDVLIGMPGLAGPQFGALIQSSEAIDLTDVRAEILDGNGVIDEKGFKYLQLRGPEELIIHQIDANTAIFGTKIFAKQMVKNPDPNSEIANILKAIRSKQDALAILSVSSLRPMLAGFAEGAPLPPQVAEDLMVLIDSTEFIALRVLMADEEKLQLVFSAIDQAGAADAADSLGRLLAFAQEQIVAEIKNEMPSNGTQTSQAMLQYIARMGEEITRALQPKLLGNRLVVEVEDFQSTSMIGSLTALLLPAVSSARMAAQRMQGSNNLKQMGLALHNFESAYKKLPATAGLDDNGEPMISWRVAILPFIEEAELYQKFNLDEPWDSEHNLALLEEMPDVFKHPNRKTEAGYTVYQAPINDQTLLRLKEPTRFANITDGTSNTIMLVETTSERAVPWTAPQDYELDMEDPTADLFLNGIGEFLFGDGSVRTISENVDLATLKALFTRAGGEAVNNF
jgi:hypothetical protein